MLQRILQTDRARSTILIRVMVGAVFLSEGVQKFLFAAEVGSGRFAKIGLPNPEFLGPFVGATEMLCGSLILLGLFTRFAAIPLIIIMLVAISTTKIPLLETKGFWGMLHDSRTDWAMLLGSCFLLLRGAGRYSIDMLLQRKSNVAQNKAGG